jgi:hypothetical protein
MRSNKFVWRWVDCNCNILRAITAQQRRPAIIRKTTHSIIEASAKLVFGFQSSGRWAGNTITIYKTDWQILSRSQGYVPAEPLTEGSENSWLMPSTKGDFTTWFMCNLPNVSQRLYTKPVHVTASVKNTDSGVPPNSYRVLSNNENKQWYIPQQSSSAPVS